MAPLTPIRVRGKRGASKEVKWHSGKKRKTLRPGSGSVSERGSSTRSTPSVTGSATHRRRKRQPELSRLEELPTEVLQTIFEFSANLNLPLTSPRLASQLASNHLYHSLTSIVLGPLLDGRFGMSNERSAAMRLMNSKFFTWPFFRSWLDEEYERRNVLPNLKEPFGPSSDQASIEQKEDWTWNELLRPSGCLPPPPKLLHGPFTEDKVRFLRFLANSFRGNPDELDHVYVERTREGLQQAVSEGAKDTLQCFWVLGMEADTELLHLAVLDSGCDKEVVRGLVEHALAVQPVVVDFLDPALWSWAEKAQANGDDKGPWLKDLLKDAVGQSSYDDVETKQTKSILYE